MVRLKNKAFQLTILTLTQLQLCQETTKWFKLTSFIPSVKIYKPIQIASSDSNKPSDTFDEF